MNITALVRFLFLGSLLPFMGHAAAAPLLESTPTLQVIIEKTLAQDSARQQALQSMQYDQMATVEQLDGSGSVTHHNLLQMIVTPGATPPWRVISMKGDNDTPSSDPVDAQAKGEDVEGNKQTFTLHDLVDRFTVTLAGTDQIDGVPAYVLAFVPKLNQPYRDDTEKVVNQLQGRIWISTRTYNVLQTDASLTHPVSVAWFLAKVPTLDFHYQAQDSDDGFAPSQVQITLEVDALIVGYHERQTIEMTHFRPRATVGTAAQAVP